jgi:hypothetical protein
MIKWSNMSKNLATWEVKEDLRQQFPAALAWDKQSLKTGARGGGGGGLQAHLLNVKQSPIGSIAGRNGFSECKLVARV